MRKWAELRKPLRRGFNLARHFLSLGALLIIPAATTADSRSSIEGVVRDPSGAAVPNAEVLLLNAHRLVLATARADGAGNFAFHEIVAGSYMLAIKARGFSERMVQVMARNGERTAVNVTLDILPIQEDITVTASVGQVEQLETIPQRVNIISSLEIAERAKSVLAQVANEEAGIYLQRTSPTIGGIFVRGLTGNKVNVFVDGVRYSTSAARGGINTFLNLIEPHSLQAVEVLRGPNSAQYGSDAIGGSVQLLSRAPTFSADALKMNFQLGSNFNSSDFGFGSDLLASLSSEKFGLIAELAGRRVNRLRPGHGLDSHNAITRFFGIRSDAIIEDRLPDTAFTQYGGAIRLSWLASPRDRFSAGYRRGQQDGGRRYDQLIGGDGNLIADLRNLMADLFNLRYDRFSLGWLDALTAVYSFNAQREERVNQGGNGNPLAQITHEYERLSVHGFQLYGAKMISRHNLIFGADYYRERLKSPSFGIDPSSGRSSLRRPRIPDGALYRSGGIYLQGAFDLIPGRLRFLSNLRYSAASYKVRAEASPIVAGRRLWPDDSLRASDLALRAGLALMPSRGLSLSFNLSRGFRAPHMTDLGTLGLTGSGFEVAATDLVGLGATIGSTADRDAISTGRPVQQLKSEASLTYEASARYRNGRLDAELTLFMNDISDTITKQALILPQGAVGLELGGQRIIAQNRAGVVFVSASSNPVLVRANFGDVRIAGLEHKLNLKISNEWSIGTVYTHLRARDEASRLPPNIEGGTPPPDGYLKLLYAPAGTRFWLEPYIRAAGRQRRLSSLDLEDRRIGAMRSRASIRSFFLNGAMARGLIAPGPDGRFGTQDDVLKLTGETLAQIQDRVLGVGVEAAPLFRALPGYLTLNLRGGLKLAEQHEVIFEFENVGDRNYRGISWGIDAPGRGIYLRYKLSL